MTWIINKIRQWFCKHEFEYIGVFYRSMMGDEIIRKRYKMNKTCKKCGWHTSYWKY